MSGGRRRLRLVDAEIALTWDGAGLVDVARSLYADASREGPPRAGVDEVALVSGAAGARVQAPGFEGAWRRRRAALFQDAELAIVELALERLRHRRLLLHAAVIAGPAGALLAVGAHDAGKTSLAVALGRAGDVVLSDEVAPLDPASLRVAPFPRDLILHRGAERAAPPGLPPSPGFKCFPGYRYLPPSAVHGSEGQVAAEVEVRGILFPQRHPAMAASLRPLGPAEAARRLLEQCFDLDGLGGRRVTDAIATLVQRPAACLDYDEAGSALALVRAWPG